MNKFFKKTLINNNRGVALLLVLSIITILSALIVEFTFDTKLNMYKVYNQQDRLQAQLNAEAGLKFALAKFRLYKEAKNIISKNKNIKDLIGPDILEGIITQPFMFPIPVNPKATMLERKAIDEFVGKSLITGKININITPVSGFLNPNNMRLSPPKKGAMQNPDNTNYNAEDEGDNKNKEFSLQLFMEKELTTLLTKLIEEKKDKDEDFAAKYSNINPSLLIKELKLYVNDKNKFTDDSKSEIENIYNEKRVTPKYAPLTSLSELYQLAGWDDAIVDLIKDKLSVHEVSVIPLNKLTDSQLKILFPDITKEQSKEFFKYRDGVQEKKGGSEEEDEDAKPHPFKSEKDFMDLIVNKLNIVEEKEYKEKVQEFEKAGLRLDVAGKLYKVEVIGESGRSTYSLTAFIDLPLKESKVKKKSKPKNGKITPNNENADNQGEQSGANTNSTNTEKKEENKPIDVLDPRVVEIFAS